MTATVFSPFRHQKVSKIHLCVETCKYSRKECCDETTLRLSRVLLPRCFLRLFRASVVVETTPWCFETFATKVGTKSDFPPYDILKWKYQRKRKKLWKKPEKRFFGESLHIAVKVKIQVTSLRISKQNIFVRNKNMTKKNFLSNIILLKNLPLIFQAKLRLFIILENFHENPYHLNFWE